MVKHLPKILNIPYLMPHASQSGQSLIILLLVMVAALTVGLSVASRTITDVSISTQSELSQKAFSAAEAGIEHALRQDLQNFVGATNQVGDATYNVEVVRQGAASSFAPPEPVAKDDVAQLNLAGTSATALDVYWQQPASLEITLLYLAGSEPKIAKWAFNSDCNRTNGFDCAVSGGTVGNVFYSHKATISLTGQPQALRLRPFYESTQVAVVAVAPPGADLPEQTVKITSTGTVSGVTRKIEVTKTVNSLPPIFDYVLYSGQDINKQ